MHLSPFYSGPLTPLPPQKLFDPLQEKDFLRNRSKWLKRILRHRNWLRAGREEVLGIGSGASSWVHN